MRPKPHSLRTTTVLWRGFGTFFCFLLDSIDLKILGTYAVKVLNVNVRPCTCVSVNPLPGSPCNKQETLEVGWHGAGTQAGRAHTAQVHCGWPHESGGSFLMDCLQFFSSLFSVACLVFRKVFAGVPRSPDVWSSGRFWLPGKIWHLTVSDESWSWHLLPDWTVFGKNIWCLWT